MHDAATPAGDQAPRPASPSRFLRVVGSLWLFVIVAILVGALTYPYIGRMTDMVLAQTTHRTWTPLSLDLQRPYFDRTTPARTIKSYYSALYRADASAMARLTAGPFRTQMHQRLAAAESVTAQPTYRSYLLTESRQSHQAVITEKFHLFWQRGLRFILRRSGTDWHLVGVELLP